MLKPEYLADLPEPILKLFYAVEQEILADMARRISTYDYWIPAAEYQNQKLREAGALQDDILKALSGITGKSDAELRKLMQEAGGLALQEDAAVYEAAGITVPSIKSSEPLREILTAGYRATSQTMKNLCRTAANTATKQFEDALDRAWLKVHSGAFDADSAIRSAVKELSEQGIYVNDSWLKVKRGALNPDSELRAAIKDVAKRGTDIITYPSGRTTSLEAAVRRAVVTGVNKTVGDLQLELAREVGCDLVEVSAHAGARPEHAVWQGKIFRIKKTS